MVSVLFERMISTSLAVSLVILLVLAMRSLLYKRYKPRTNCFVWAIIAVRLADSCRRG